MAKVKVKSLKRGNLFYMRKSRNYQTKIYMVIEINSQLTKVKEIDTKEVYWIDSNKAVAKL